MGCSHTKVLECVPTLRKLSLILKHNFWSPDCWFGLVFGCGLSAYSCVSLAPFSCLSILPSSLVSKSLPLDIELDHHGDSLPKGKQDPIFENKPELGIKLIDLTLSRDYQPGIVIIDTGYGHNTSFLLKIENWNLK